MTIPASAVSPSSRSSSRPASRDAPRNRLFASLFAIMLANALSHDVVRQFAHGQTLWQVVPTGLGESWVVWAAIAAALRLAWRAAPDAPTGAQWLAIAAAALAVLVPFWAVSWVAVTLLALFLALLDRQADARLRAAATVLASVSVSCFWTRLLVPYLVEPVERFDAQLAALMAGTSAAGNVVAAQAGMPYQVTVLPGCTSFANISFALVLYLAVARTARPAPGPREWRAVLGVAAVVLAVNTARLAAMTVDLESYRVAHGPLGGAIANALMLLGTLAVTGWETRRELFPAGR